jgi:hypothetical protein
VLAIPPRLSEVCGTHGASVTLPFWTGLLLRELRGATAAVTARPRLSECVREAHMMVSMVGDDLVEEALLYEVEQLLARAAQSKAPLRGARGHRRLATTSPMHAWMIPQSWPHSCCCCCCCCLVATC